MAALLQRQFVLLSIITAVLFVLSGLMALGGNRSVFSSSTVQQATAHISSLALLSLMSKEVPALEETVQPRTGQETDSFTSFAFGMLTGINPGDLRSLLGRELPGLLTFDDARLVVAGKGTGLDDLYVESPAPPRTVIDASPAGDVPAPSPEETETDAEGKTAAERPASPPPNPTTAGKKVVFVYNTHNRESWLSVAKMNPATGGVDHETKNISLVGKRFAEALEERGIGAEYGTKDFYSMASFPLAYAESLKAVKAAAQEHRELRYFIDIHRDGKPRSKTTVTINGKAYARVFFVIGLRNKNYEKNTQFAHELHELIEKKYPGLSRGVTEKSAKEGNGEYNQSFSPGSLLVEIGGIENTLQECYNTAEALADVFAEYYWQAERVSGEMADKPDKR
ncbi:stage II sporulation protein P [Brevibacillus sp. SYP-B805]|uniref:stage II sporulation protein P n=1 Tax=Brevibacillus sp. SYP-B805 TaxID=1578199 RepID=UPI0013EB5794|nr:stage II sporulation protein P [Brevibacillus sp. SYP-B805]NGQ94161.1 stage II sporulation protein P [Brevibacillus sp. SYP-B805]